MRFGLLILFGCVVALGAAETPPGEERTAQRLRELAERNPTSSTMLDRLWDWHQEKGRSAQLLQAYENAPDFPRALLLAQLLRKAGRNADARTAAERAAKLDPKSPLPWLMLADLSAADSNPAGIAAALASALERFLPNDPKRAEILLRLAAARNAQGDTAGAVGAWEQAAALEPGNFSLRAELAKSLEQAGQLERAFDAWTAIAKSGSPAERLEAWRELARLHQLHDDFEAARDALEQALALTGRGHWRRGELQLALIRLYQRAGREAELIAAWEREAAAAPRDLARVLRLAELQEELGDSTAQAAGLERVLALAPRDRQARLKFARLLAERGDWQRAADEYDRLLREAPKPPLDLVLARADLDVQLGRGGEATARLGRYVATQGGDEAARAAVAAFYQRNHFDAEGEAMFVSEHERNPASDEALLALADFYFSQHKSAAAKSLLERWTAARTGEAPAARAGRLEAAASRLRAKGFSAEARPMLKEALALQPAAPQAWRIALADLLVQEGDGSQARRVLEEAAANATADSERLEAEERLYQLLQASGVPLQSSTPPSGGGRISVPAADNPVVRDFLNELEYAARQPEARPEDGLRLARFQARAGVTEIALETALRVVKRFPALAAARELVVRLASESGRKHVVTEQLAELVKIDPAHSRAHRRALARARIENRDVDEGIDLLRELEREQPGAPEPLVDLADALQRAERWFDAVAAWERAYAAAAPARRGELRSQFIVALEKVGGKTRAAELISAGVDGESDPRRRLEAFRDLLSYCRNAGLLDWLAARAETRLRGAPQDYFALAALAEVRRAQGREADAYALQQRAYFSAPQPANALQDLVATAEDRGDLASALRQQRRLLRLPGQGTAENLERLAGLEESALDLPAAAETWLQIVARFPRDIAALERAVEHFRKTGDAARERELLQRLANLDATDATRILRLAQLNTEAGEPRRARTALEQFLEVSEPEPAGAKLRLPVEIGESRPRVAARFEPPPPLEPTGKSPDLRPRLEAVAMLGRLVAAEREPKTLAAWTERWRARAAAEPSAALAAWFHAGRADLVLTWLDTQPPGDEQGRGFVAVALEGGQFERLGAWLNAPAERDVQLQRRAWMLDGVEVFLRVRLAQPVPPGLVAALFPPQFRSRFTLWGEAVARIFAAQHRYREAADLGSRFLVQTRTNRAAYAAEIARWFLFLGESDNARTVLRFGLDGVNNGDSLDLPYFEALRLAFFLQPAADRSRWADAQRAQSAATSGPAQSALVGAWLHGLAGETKAACAALDRWLALRPALARDSELNAANGFLAQETPLAGRHLAAALANGTRLDLGQMPALAIHLWRGALAGPLAGGATDDRTRDLRRELKHRLHMLEWSEASPGETASQIAQYLATQPALDEVTTFAGALASRQMHGPALQLREYLLALEPGNADHWRGAAAALRAMGDFAGLREMLERQLTRVQPGTGVNPRDIVLQLVDLEEKLGNLRAARELLERHLQINQRENYFRQRLAQNCERAGLLDEAAAHLRAIPERDSNYAYAVQNLAALEERRGHPAEALRLLDLTQRRGGPVSSEVASRSVRLLLLQGRAETAREIALGLIRAGQHGYAVPLAGVFTENGERTFAIELLQEAAQKSREPQVRLNLAQTLLENYLSPAEDAAAYAHEINRLRQAATTPQLQSMAWNVRAALAQKHHTEDAFERELTREWHEGAGEAAAGQRLTALLAARERKDELLKAARQYLARPDAVTASPEPAGQPLCALENQLRRCGLLAQAVEAIERVFRRYPHNDAFAVAYAAALHRAGRTAEARAALAEAQLRWLINPSILRLLVPLRLDLGDRPGALDALELAVRLSPHGEALPLHFQLARLRTEAGDFAEARRVLKIAFRNPNARDLAPLLELLEKMPGDDLEAPAWRIAGDFQLQAELRSQLPTLLALRLFQAGKSAAARRLVAARPTLLATASEVASALVSATESDEDFVEGDRLLREAMVQAAGPHERLAQAAAQFHLRWAERAYAEGRADLALGRLGQARAWCPSAWTVIKRLVELRTERGEKAQAKSALNEFLACPEARTADRESARLMLVAL